MDKILKLLLVEDVNMDAEIIWQEIEKNKITFRKLLVSNRNDFLQGLKSFQPDIIIFDSSLSQFNWKTDLFLLNELTQFIPIILLTDSINEEITDDCIKAGVNDYIPKDNLSRLGLAVHNSVAKIELHRGKKAAEDELYKSELRLHKAQSIAHIGSWEGAINQERRMLRTLIDNLPDMIYVKDFDCRKVIANIADVNNIGFEKEEEVLAKTDLELFPGQIGKRGYMDDKEVINSGKAIIGREEDFVNSKGIRRWLLTSKFPLRDEVGKITGIVGIGHDITERKKAEAELVKAKNKAEESDRLKTAFLHNLSHEIRTPLNAIVGFVTLFLEPEADSKVHQAYSEIIMQSSDHLLSIITDIIDISNIEANLVKSDKKELNLNSSLKSLYNQFNPIAAKKKIALTLSTPLHDDDSFILTDTTKIIQILSNLLNNSIKFTNEGNIKIGYEIKSMTIEFSISDTGIGIAPENHEKIFDRFFQVKNSVSRMYEGMGLGLAITKAYVQLLGGKIWVSSQPGKGSTFYFTVPYVKSLKPEIPDHEKLIFTGLKFSEKRTILVAEDIESNFNLIKYFLKESNAEIIRAVNGQEAVEMCLSNTKIDLIVMDIKMPIMDGLTAVRLIRKANITIPIIAQTAYHEDRETAIECGCSGFISKPFDKKDLLKILKEYI